MRGGGRGDRAATLVGASASADLGRVGLLHDDARRVDAQCVGCQLRERGLHALADIRAARLHAHYAVLVEPHACGVHARDGGHAAAYESCRARTCELDVGADTDAHEPAGRARPGALGARAPVVKTTERHLECSLVIARLVWMTG